MSDQKDTKALGGEANPALRIRARLAGRKRQRVEITPEIEAELLQRITEGEFPTDVCVDETMPTYSQLMAHYVTSPEFSERYDMAIAACANANVADAAAFSRAVTEEGDPDSQRIAETYTRAINAAIEKLSPKSHGQLLKVSGAEGGALEVAVVNYGDNNKATES